MNFKWSGFGHAWKGIRVSWKEEPHFRVHVFLGIIAMGLGVTLQISRWEWALLITIIGMVTSAELFNTAIENLCNKVSGEIDPTLGKVKDAAAAAVLITAIIALMVGLMIFLPRLYCLLVSWISAA